MQKCPRAPCGGCGCSLHVLSLILPAGVYHCWGIFNMNRTRHKALRIPRSHRGFHISAGQGGLCGSSLSSVPARLSVHPPALHQHRVQHGFHLTCDVPGCLSSQELLNWLAQRIYNPKALVIIVNIFDTGKNKRAPETANQFSQKAEESVTGLQLLIRSFTLLNKRAEYSVPGAAAPAGAAWAHRGCAEGLAWVPLLPAWEQEGEGPRPSDPGSAASCAPWQYYLPEGFVALALSGCYVLKRITFINYWV